MMRWQRKLRLAGMALAVVMLVVVGWPADEECSGDVRNLNGNKKDSMIQAGRCLRI
jgi:hypothetical protein